MEDMEDEIIQDQSAHESRGLPMVKNEDEDVSYQYTQIERLDYSVRSPSPKTWMKMNSLQKYSWEDKSNLC